MMQVQARKSDSARAEGEVKPFLDHLEDLRHCIVRCLLALACGMGVAVPLAPRVMAWITKPLAVVVEDPSRFLRSLEVSGAFSIVMRLTFWSGLILTAPILLFLISGFVFPGLTQQERRVLTRSSGLAAGLFALGVFMGYRMTLPVALKFMFGLHGWLGISAEWTVNNYVSFAMQLLLGFGLVFELPVVLLILGRLGIVSSRQLRGLRKHAIVAALILGMILTPPDVFSQTLMAVPLVALYEICIWLVWASERKRQSAPAVDEAG